MTETAPGPSTIHEFAETVVRRLADAQTEDGRLRDPLVGTEIEPFEYAQTSFATAAIRIGHMTGDESLSAAGFAALDLFFESDLPAGYGDEFSTFAVQELLESDFILPEDHRERIDNFVAYRAGRRTEQGNNWLLLQALCRYRHGRLRDRLLSRYILSLSRSWAGSDGLLADQPRRPRKTRETPLVYHAKMAMCLVRMTAAGADIDGRADSALRTLAHLTRADGEFGYYGRSENTLFGYACALDAVVRRQRQVSSSPEWLANLGARLRFFISEQFDPTVVNVQPTTQLDYTPIDGYVKRAVYGAYAAMLFTGLPDRELPAANPKVWLMPESTSVSSPEWTVPFRHWTGRNVDLTVSTTGQLKITKNGPDPRYAGGIPVAMKAGGERVVAGVPSEYTAHATLPYLPRINTPAGAFAPVTWKPRAGPALFVGEARFHELPTEGGRSTDESVDDSGGSGQPSGPRRLLRRLLSRTFVERVVTDRRKRPTQIPVELTRAIHAADGFVLMQDVFSVSGDAASPLTVVPASVTVREGIAEAIERRTSDDRSPGRNLTSDCSHWGPATWVTADARPVTDSLSIVTLIDPTDRVRDLSHPAVSESPGTVTRIMTDDGAYTFECPEPKVP